ncbi:MAG: HAD family phosphatase [bacterium]|nr:HAD family phosphatase [bacterium]
MTIEAKYILFDFDGVFADTEPFHYEAFKKTLNKYNIDITWKQYKEKYLAYDDKGAFMKIFLEIKHLKLNNKSIRKLIRQKSIFYNKIIHKIKPYNDAIEFIKKLHKNIKCAIVSGALKKEIEFLLKKFGIMDRFLFIVSADSIKEGKPSPYPYIFAFKELKKFIKNAKKKDVVVIEDSINGVISAKKAGFRVLAVAHTYKPQHLKADYVVRSLKHVKII